MPAAQGTQAAESSGCTTPSAGRSPTPSTPPAASTTTGRPTALRAGGTSTPRRPSCSASSSAPSGPNRCWRSARRTATRRSGSPTPRRRPAATSSPSRSSRRAPPSPHAFELTFLDAQRKHYAGWWPDLVRTLAPSGLLAVDNAISHANELVEFRAVVDGDERVTQALVPIGAGLLLVVTPG